MSGRIKKYLTNNTNEIKKINWISEIIKAIVIFGISTIVLFEIRKLSPGSYEEEKLKLYLQKEIENTLKEENAKITVSKFLRKETYEPLSESDVMLMYCEYELPTSECGRAIVLFERRNKNIWYELIGAIPPYYISFIRKISIAGMPSETFYYVDNEVEDIDFDGKKEILLSMQSNTATKIIHVELLLSKESNEWKIITPSLEIMDKVKVKAKEEKLYTYYADYELVDPRNSLQKDIVYGIPDDGEVYITKNPFSEEIDLCFELPANDENDNGYYIYTMMKLVKGELKIDDNWNGGELLILRKGENFLERKDLYWGYERTEHFNFYSAPRG